MVLLHLLAMAYLVFFVAAYTGFAVHNFNAKKYFGFGIDIAMLIYTVCSFVKMYFSI
jgi:hypothetical protein